MLYLTLKMTRGENNMSRHPQELDINDWQSLHEGETIRVACSHWKCQGKSNAFTITRTYDGCVYNCYRCGTTSAIHLGSSPSSAQRKLKQLRQQRRNADPDDFVVALPNDFIPMITHHKDIPPQAYGWIYKYELTDDDIYKHHIGYAPNIQRVVVPIFDVIRLANGLQAHKLVAWQGRDIFYDRNLTLFDKGILKRKPMRYYTESKSNIHHYNNKIMNNKIRIISNSNNSNNKIYFKIISKSNNNNNIIIIEDILSCIKVYNKYQCDSVALLNSTITNNLVNLLKQYQHVIIWLDWDARTKSIKASRQLQSQGIRATTIRTSLDPKAVPYLEMPKI